MTCEGCANSIEKEFGSNSTIHTATVSLENKELTIESNQQFNSDQVDSILSSLGNYRVALGSPRLVSKIVSHFEPKKPVLLALVVVIVSSLSLQKSHGTFDLNNWFATYMGMFFVLFSFLKLLNVKGFSVTFSKYDILAKRMPGFATSYPFLEFLLGVAFLTGTVLVVSNIITLVVMLSQSIGVANVLKNNQTIQCACMGSSINLSVSYLTLLENIVMVLMSGYMTYQFIY